MSYRAKVGLALLSAGLLLATAMPAAASAYIPGSGWQTFSTTFDTLVMDPEWNVLRFGGMSTVDPITFQDVLREPFTFALAGDAWLKVTDMGQTGDYYDVWNHGAADPLPDTVPGHHIGQTSLNSWGPAMIADVPDFDFAFSSILSHGQWLLPAGNYNLEFMNNFYAHPDGMPLDWNGAPLPDAALSSDAAFRVDMVNPIPEPASLALLGLGLAAAGLVARRKR